MYGSSVVSSFLLSRSAQSVLQLAAGDTLADQLTTQFAVKYGFRPSVSEQRSWRLSLPALAQELVECGLGEVEMLVEYQLPLSSLRADVVLAGVHPGTGRSSYVVVELKQWSSATVEEDEPRLCTVPGAKRALLHPVSQVEQYCEYLVDFTRVLHDSTDDVVGVAYLHNADDAGVASLLELPPRQYGQMFTASNRSALRTFLNTRLAPKPGIQAAEDLTNSRIAPSRQLMAVAADEIKHQRSFVLLDEQQVAYLMVLRAVRRAQDADSKEVIIINGGPGSGKSVIALELLGELFRNGYSAIHATGSKSFTTTLRKIAGKGTTRVQKLFQYFNSFSQAGHNHLTVLINDEAHRIRETSNNRYTPAAKRSTKPQVEELIDAARVPVFLLDEHQVVRPGELGSYDEIHAKATEKGFTVRRIDLDGQFRCGGSRTYEQWVLDLLGLSGNPPASWQSDDRFELAVADSPAALEAHLATKLDQGFGARMTAGFCWPWSDAHPSDGLVDDVVIGSWKRPWNVKGDRGVNGAPPSQLWATDPAGFGQVGCIYTAQGFEYDWNGVLFGPDLVWRTDHWVADPSASKDTVVARAKADEFERLIKHTYKVLLTRGMQGTVLYSTDAETQALFHALADA
ncbi:ATP-binding protein [Streptomyces sp. WAC 05977]|nr:ATP-binding protein [Streptomyces sp. WAC 05977]